MCVCVFVCVCLRNPRLYLCKYDCHRPPVTILLQAQPSLSMPRALVPPLAALRVALLKARLRKVCGVTLNGELHSELMAVLNSSCASFHRHISLMLFQSLIPSFFKWRMQCAASSTSPATRLWLLKKRSKVRYKHRLP